MSEIYVYMTFETLGRKLTLRPQAQYRADQDGEVT